MVLWLFWGFQTLAGIVYFAVAGFSLVKNLFMRSWRDFFISAGFGTAALLTTCLGLSAIVIAFFIDLENENCSCGDFMSWEIHDSLVTKQGQLYLVTEMNGFHDVSLSTAVYKESVAFCTTLVEDGKKTHVKQNNRIFIKDDFGYYDTAAQRYKQTGAVRKEFLDSNSILVQYEDFTDTLKFHL